MCADGYDYRTAAGLHKDRLREAESIRLAKRAKLASKAAIADSPAIAVSRMAEPTVLKTAAESIRISLGRKLISLGEKLIEA